MTKKSCKAGKSRQEQSLANRSTKSVMKTQRVVPSEKKDKAGKLKEPIFIDDNHSDSHTHEPASDEDDGLLAVDDPENMWIQALTWYKKSPEDEIAEKTGYTEYPKFPPNYFDVDVPRDGSIEIIELKDPNTICPGSPGYLPDRIRARKWFHDVVYGRYVGNPYKKMVQYAELTSDRRIPVEEAKKRGLKGGDDKCWYDKVNWYGDILHGKTPRTREDLPDSDSIESDPSEDKPEEDVIPEEPKTPESKYVPVKYPIYPPSKNGTEARDSYSWNMISPSWGPTLTLNEPRRTPPKEEEPVILLRGSDTILPGSPGQLPEYIYSKDWWNEVRNPNNNGKYQKMIKYSELTWMDRIPIAPHMRKRTARPTQATMDWYNSYLFPDQNW